MRATARKNQPRLSNRRLSTSRQRRQQHLLDVKVRTRRASHHRNRRILVLISKVVLVVATGGAIYYGVRVGLKRFFFDNPDYRLSTIAIRTDGTLQRDQVLQNAGLREGLNIFSVNLAQVHDRLEKLGQVDEVQVERRLPNEIDITITERKPIAWITSERSIIDPFASDAAFLVDARGNLMKEKQLLPEYLALPVITGCSDEALAAGKTVSSFEAKAALELLRLTTTSFMQTRFQIREIDVSKGYCLLVTDKNHVQVSFGFDRLEEQMQRLEQLLVYSDDMRHEIASVNLLVARNIPVTFAQHPSEIIQQLQPGPAPNQDETAASVHGKPGESPAETGRDKTEPGDQAREVRRAKAANTPIPVRKALPYSPGVKKFHASPTPMPVRKAIPLQRFQEEKRNG